MTEHDADVVIAGAGLSGLSLAVQLVERGPAGLRIALVDPRTDWPRDRTWCRWLVDSEDDPFVDCISHRWTRWRVRDASRQVERASARHPYCQVPADAFYGEALRRLEASGRVALHTGCAVRALEARDGGVAAVVEGLGELRARLAFDSRPLPGDGLGDPRPGDVALLQHFKGRFVRTQRPCFTPERVELMDFDVDQSHGIAFVYVLPYSAHEALVEATWFSPERHPPHVYDAMLDTWLERHGGADAEVLDEERGAIPMSTALTRQPAGQSARIQHIGLAGGLARPSTGYAFLAIQRHARALAEALRRDPAGVPGPAPVRARHTELLDAVFLGWLVRYPERAPAMFVEMFERTDPDRLVRFLSEAGSLRDTLAVMRACPALSFMAEAMRLPLRRT